MKIMLAATLLVLAMAVTAAHATPPRSAIHADNPTDSARSGRGRPNLPNMPEAAQSPTNEQVGDGDSFGRSVNFLGLAQPNGVAVSTDCTDTEPGSCVVVTDPAQTTSIQFIGNDAVVQLPARSARSLLCFTLSPLGDFNFINESASRQQAFGSFSARWRIESDVLNDPALINPDTGLPYGGFLQFTQQLAFEWHTLDAGEQKIVVPSGSRSCISGHLSRRSLIGMGLTEAQAREVFRKPITIRFGASASIQYGTAFGSYGVRIYGD